MKLKSDDDFFCYQESCPKTRLTGSSMKRADWPRHKPRCKRLIAKAALDGPLSAEFARWQEMGSSLYECISDHALRGHADVEYIESKFILLTLRLRDPPGTENHLQIFRFHSIQLLDMSDLGTVTNEPTEDLVQEMGEWATKMKLRIVNPSGAAWIFTEIRSPDGSKRLLLRHRPAAQLVATLNGNAPPPTVAENMIAMMINHGTGVKGPYALPRKESKQAKQYLVDHPEQFEVLLQRTIDSFAEDGDGQSSQEST
ncbi:hypothetical protein FB45DRAFT_1143502 [Roridomyces roridus]|uniref:Uncharacterized protein n=1 Tax=Roridomyces roridus TaxID=1738132 RepID=A0AAD7C223_9AGAR|nr:hypothetical protein FB45DRAFT_1143502 [Roridomyces roridus]